MQEYSKADQQIHWLSQIIAKVNRAYVPEKKDDSHTNLYFDALGKKILGRWIEIPQGKIILALNLETRQFEWLDNKLHTLGKVQVLNKEQEQLEKDTSEYPVSLGMETDSIFLPLHYEIPDYQFSRIDADEWSAAGLKSWMYYRDLANQACSLKLGYLQAESEIRIWPHHFDTGIFSQVSQDFGLGFGLAMEDEMAGEPYFYMAGYNGESPISYNNPAPLSAGKWEIGEHWKGALLPLSTLSKLSGNEAMGKTKAFIKETVDWFLQQ